MTAPTTPVKLIYNKCLHILPSDKISSSAIIIRERHFVAEAQSVGKAVVLLQYFAMCRAISVNSTFPRAACKLLAMISFCIGGVFYCHDYLIILFNPTLLGFWL